METRKQKKISLKRSGIELAREVTRRKIASTQSLLIVETIEIPKLESEEDHKILPREFYL